MTYQEDIQFEDEARRIARARWPQAEFDGAAIINGRERDGVFETDDVIHYVEATTSRREDKAKEDTKKIFALMTEQQRLGSMKGSVGWFVTQGEPTADQREAVKQYGKNQVKAVSFTQFQQAIVDVQSYFSKRENHLFGSISDPATGSLQPQVAYVPLGQQAVVVRLRPASACSRPPRCSCTGANWCPRCWCRASPWPAC